MKKIRVYLVPSLIAAGFMPLKSEAATVTGLIDKKAPNTLFERLRVKHVYTLAGHSSHSSHASHASHASSSGGGYVVPRRDYGTGSGTTYVSPDPTPSYSPNVGPPVKSFPPAPTSPVTTSPSVEPSPLKTLPGNSNKFRRIVIQVQTALIAYGYFGGPITGQVDAATRAGLSKMQTAYDLKVTGTITPQVLSALGISAN
ncbi:His-Xaa-Ser repeat protein HxsA [Agrobacterium vitis]